ncbi:MAG: 2-hydroxychromene-2-carboxylate isomerase [Parvibaculales bacterium]
MTKQVEFYYDFGSPNSYLANQVLPGVCAEHGAELVYRPCLLGGIFKATGNQAPWLTFANVQPRLDYDMMEIDRFARKHGLHDYKLNPHFPLNTLMLMRMACAVEMSGDLAGFIGVTEKAIWEQGLKMDEPDIAAKALTDAGLDGAALVEQAQQPEVKERLIKNTEEAVNRKLFGLPTFFVGDEMFFGKDRLRDIEDEISIS